MNKKILVGLLCGALSFGTVIEASASEAVVRADRTMINESVYEGEWVTFFEDIFQLYIPKEWEKQTVTEKEKENDLYYCYQSDDGENGILIYYMDPSYQLDLETVEENIKASETYSEPQRWTANGIDILVFDDTESAFSIACPAAEGGMFLLVIQITDAEDFGYISNLVSSFSPAVVEENETETEILQ